MHLYVLPIIFVLAGLVLYMVLAGADFGAGFWQLAVLPGPLSTRIRDHAHESMAPVWEANHVWLIFVLTVTWTAYPVFLGSIASTLAVPLALAGLGIILRGAAYALSAGTATSRERRLIDTVTGFSSVLTPFALGAAVGAIAARRVPVGNAAGGLISSWTGPVSVLVGVLAVVSAAYLAAVYLAADAARHGQAELVRSFRARALGAGVLAGAVAIAGLVVLHADVHPLYHRLTAGAGLPALLVSIVAGVATLALVWTARFEAARYVAAIAVAATIAGWALSQEPLLLPGLTLAQAAAPYDTQVALLVAVLAGGAILFPSLALLFRLLLGGSFAGEPQPQAPRAGQDLRALLSVSQQGLLGRVAVACLLGGFGFLTVADAPWAHVIGVICLFAFVIVAFFALVLPQLAEPG
jgi:cytochrome d ubiquinol oxidase subunit II